MPAVFTIATLMLLDEEEVTIGHRGVKGVPMATQHRQLGPKSPEQVLCCFHYATPGAAPPRKIGPGPLHSELSCGESQGYSQPAVGAGWVMKSPTSGC